MRVAFLKEKRRLPRKGTLNTTWHKTKLSLFRVDYFVYNQYVKKSAIQHKVDAKKIAAVESFCFSMLHRPERKDTNVSDTTPAESKTNIVSP